jgi:hypothetical protein
MAELEAEAAAQAARPPPPSPKGPGGRPLLSATELRDSKENSPTNGGRRARRSERREDLVGSEDLEAARVRKQEQLLREMESADADADADADARNEGEGCCPPRTAAAECLRRPENPRGSAQASRVRQCSLVSRGPR